MRFFCLVLVLVFAALLLAANDEWVIREDGTGPVKIGMSVHDLRKVLQQRVRTSDDLSGADSCFYLKPEGHPYISFMILDGHLVRVEVDRRGVATSTGIQVGDAEAHTLQVYGKKIKVSPHKYIDDGHYLTVRSADGKSGIRFETEKGKITSFYAGTYEAIQYVEGCL